MMKLSHLQEPELEFGLGQRHVDIRYGLMDNGPFDTGQVGAPSNVRLGLIGDAETVDGVREWLIRCHEGIEAKTDTRLTNLYPPFPGTADDGPFKVPFILVDQDTRTISTRKLKKLEGSNPLTRSDRYAELFIDELRALADGNSPPSVVIVALPIDVIASVNAAGDDGDLIEGEPGPEDDLKQAPTPTGVDFRARLKIAAMRYGVPIQIVQPVLYDPKVKIPLKTKPENSRDVQEDATRAWNFFTALYYKAGGLPWRLARDARQLRSCFIGISFHKTPDGRFLDASTAQMFDERGEGLILRGGRAAELSEDRRPYMTEGDAHDLLSRSLKHFRDQHHHYPARVVLHKSSPFHAQEMAGFEAAIDECDIDNLDCLAISKASLRLYREGNYPPLRGTLLRLDGDRAVLYTRGGVDFFRTYTGMYVPSPLMIRSQAPSQPVSHNAAEVLALTKMNWNNTQFDNGFPITLAASKNVGKILKYVTDDDPLKTRYSFFM
ncbi:hypothetical protein GCM10008024_30350 [Allgaiera indica]|uniref:Protein argonaute n=1 Tax=Allgaiera indica TaxID=765699 RepID=A0AAN4UU92_9RHOB|nr:hypothetical protein [Allgaiera indica]GHE04182.1 hypothetical protein GCM10008024_30350 [Allgaiera indica]SDX50611.1 hypothetical protein SAMN05444006_11854 [Allgaiera indica]